MLRLCPYQFSRCILSSSKLLQKRCLFSLDSCELLPEVKDAISKKEAILPVDTSIFLFDKGIQQNCSFIQSQIDIAKKMNVVAAHCALVDGVVKIGLSSKDLVQLQKRDSKLVECDINNIDSLMQSKSSGYFTTSLVSYIGNLLNCPFTVSGFIKGLDKMIMTSSCDIESLRSSHSTNVNCGFDLLTDVYTTIPYMTSNNITMITPGFHYIPLVYDQLFKMKSEVVTFSSMELNSLLLQNEHMNFPVTYTVSIHSQNTARAHKITKLLPSVQFDWQRSGVSFQERSRFMHNSLMERSAGVSKLLFMSSFKTALRTALLLVQRRNETHLASETAVQHENTRRNALADAQVKGLLDDAIRWGDAHEFSQDPLNESPDESAEDSQDDSPDETPDETPRGSKRSEVSTGYASNASINQNMDAQTWNSPFVTMYNEVDPKDTLFSTSSTSSASSAFPIPSEAPLHCSPYVVGSPIFIGEVGTGLYSQPSAIPNRSGVVFHDLGGVARNTYEIFLRLCPTKRPLLIGAIGEDAAAQKIRDNHGRWNDRLEGVKSINTPTLEIRGFYNKYGYIEKEYRSVIESGVSPSQVMEWRDSIENASSVLIDSSVSTDSQRKLVSLLEASKTKVFVNPCDCHRLASLLDSSLLQRADYLFVSVDELWEIATLCRPDLRSRRDEWIERSSKRWEFAEAIVHLKEPLKAVLKEMHRREGEDYILLNLGPKGIAVTVQEDDASDMDVVFFANKQARSTFESNIAAEEAFMGGFIYGLEMDYPLNLSMGLGIGTVRLNSRYKQIIAPTLRDGVHSHFISTYLKQLWGLILC